MVKFNCPCGGNEFLNCQKDGTVIDKTATKWEGYLKCTTCRVHLPATLLAGCKPAPAKETPAQEREREFNIRHLSQLIGKRVTGVVHDPSGDPSDIYGLAFEDVSPKGKVSGKGMVAWILMDPEGNGPGHLEIAKAG